MADSIGCFAFTKTWIPTPGWDRVSDNLLVKVFASEDEALLYRCTHETKDRPLRIIADADGSLDTLVAVAKETSSKQRHFLQAQVTIPPEVMDTIIRCVGSSGKWTAEAEIARVASLTPYQWERLYRSEFFLIQQRKRGFVFRLSAEGKRKYRWSTFEADLEAEREDMKFLQKAIDAEKAVVEARIASREGEYSAMGFTIDAARACAESGAIILPDQSRNWPLFALEVAA